MAPSSIDLPESGVRGIRSQGRVLGVGPVLLGILNKTSSNLQGQNDEVNF